MVGPIPPQFLPTYFLANPSTSVKVLSLDGCMIEEVNTINDMFIAHIGVLETNFWYII